MKKPLVSVIVLTYNSADTIAQALDSVLAQKCDFDFEIIVGDDCSSDDTVCLVRQYAAVDPRIILRLASENQGVQANYFGCLEVARGAFIADCAGDDFWCGTDRLQRLVDALLCNEKASFAHSDWNVLNMSDGTITRMKPRCNRNVKQGESVAEVLYSTGCPAVHLSASVYRKSALWPEYIKHKELFTDSRFGCEDLQTIAALTHVGAGIYLPFVSLVYRVGHTSAITSHTDYARSARFSLSTALLRVRLSALYLASPDVKVCSAVDSLARFSLAQAVNSGDRLLIDRVSASVCRLSETSLRTRMVARVALSRIGLSLLRAAKSVRQKLRNRK